MTNKTVFDALYIVMVRILKNKVIKSSATNRTGQFYQIWIENKINH